MSKVYKSDQITLGTPKPLINTFLDNTRHKPEEALNEMPAAETANAEEDANNIIEDAKEMYLRIIEEANSEAKKIVADAEGEAQKLLYAAKEDGYREGFEAGYGDSRNEARSIIDEAIEIREFLDKRKCDIYKEAEEQIIKLVLDISKKVIGEEVSQNKEAVLSLVNMALQKCAFRKKLVLKVSPQDHGFILDNKDRVCKLVEGISDLDIEADISLEAGSCIVETPSGEINSSIDVQIMEIEKIFTYMLGNE